ncbi:Helix-turn-helix domain-containing protein [Cruoricaptor ignavus]|uniref:Helix-turn-helix domain-containing protein n=1 Tax=Cruoricaptor ignavus TaxID=1118202 RepID=A0A1M5ZXC3_9FLAO|nr:helix-turn-helix domain-containing protein [Cruoricaptor ignavus]SHI28818.1 Helix-turn-helix domain-containing protein [Cruoricaptor ignavus]
MAVDLITREDFEAFKKEMMDIITVHLNSRITHQKLWLRSSEVKEILKVSSGTLQNLRIKGKLRYSKIGGTLYYDYRDIDRMLEESKNPGMIL